MIMRKLERFMTMVALPLLLITGCGEGMSTNDASKSPKINEFKGETDAIETPFEDNNSAGLRIQENGSDYLISLSEDVYNQVESCSLSIIEHGDNGYLLLLYNREEEILENGKIFISKEQPVLTLREVGTEQSILIPNVKEESNENGELRWTPDWLQYAPNDTSFECGLLNVTVFKKADYNDVLSYMTDPRSIEGDNPLAGIVGLDYWNNVRIIYKYKENIKDTYGNTVHITSDNSTGGVYSVTYPFEDVAHDLRFQMSSVKELEGAYYGQINVRLRNGNSIYTDLFLLNENGELDLPETPNDETVTAEVQTETGIMSFYLYDDSALLASYNGKDETVRIPEYVAGKPVTEIGKNAFANADIRHVVFPDTLIKIDQLAFQGAHLIEEIILPENLEYIGNNAFGGVGKIVGFEERPVIQSVSIGKKIKWIGDGAFCAVRIKEFIVNDENSYYSSANGVLYTKDMSYLLEYPVEKEGDFTVPEGVKSIGMEAFSGVGMFFDTNPMNSLILSDTVEHFYPQNLPRGLHHLYVGSGLKEWKYISNCTDVDRLEISKENQNFVLEDGAIYDKNKTTLLKYIGIKTRFNIPSTVSIIASNAFNTDRILEELSIPATLTVSGDQIEQELSALSNQLSNLLALREIKVENGNPFFRSVDGVLYANEGKVLVSYPSKKLDPLYEILEGTEIICVRAFSSNEYVSSLDIPASLIAFRMADDYSICLKNTAITEVSIDDANSVFRIEYPFIINKTDNSIYHYFSNGQESTVTVPEGISEIQSEIFTENYAPTYFFMEGVKSIDRGNFCGMSVEDQWDIIDVFLPASLTNISSESFVNSPAVVIHAPEGSFAEEFAHEKDLSFQSVR